VIGVLAVLSLIEFFADKIPAVNHINDAIQTFVRPAAGAIAFAASAKVITDVNPALGLILGLLVAGSVHAVKSAAVRPMVTATTGGAGNIPVSIAEDIISTILSLLSIALPFLMILFVIVLVILTIYLLLRRRRAPARY
jgi:large-conductance mechanosensitive channel